MARKMILPLFLITCLSSIALYAAPAPESEQNGSSVEPDSPAPTQPPPAPPSKIPDPPAAKTTQDAPQGQWVFTEQYGWVWMPYGDPYTRSPVLGGDSPLMYLYYPVVGWCWVEAPWIWGWGPMPYFGVYGTVHFGWWGHGYGHWNGFRGPAGRPHAWGRGYYHGGTWHQARPLAAPRSRMGR